MSGTSTILPKSHFHVLMVKKILTVDVDRKRIALTAKKSLIESTLPIISRLEDAKVGVVTHAVVFRATAKILQIEFYNGLKAIVPAREVRYEYRFTVA